MKKLKSHINRLRTNHSRYPRDLIIKIKGERAKCKYCGRTPLVENFDFYRKKDGIEEVCCFECKDAGRGDETAMDCLLSFGYVVCGLKNYEFPMAPETGTPKSEYAGKCNICGKSVFQNPYTRKLIGAYHELLRDILVHNKCERIGGK